MDDRELLRRYVTGDGGAFEELVRRHRRWVYSVCLRRLGDAWLAEDATQVVFLALAREAGKVARHPRVMGWLHRASRFTAMKIRREVTRRVRREREVGVVGLLKEGAGGAAEWEGMGGVIEEAMDRLSVREREAVLLRFYRQMSHAEVGRAMGISEEAAKKRVNRALERLRGMVGVHGVTGAAIGAALVTHAVVRVPAAFAAGVGESGSGAGAAGVASGHVQVMTQGVLQMMGRAKLMTVAGWTTAALVVVAAATVPLVRGAAEGGGAPVAGGIVATTGPAESAVVVAEREELLLAQRVLLAIQRQGAIVSLTPEFLFRKQEWERRVAKLQLRLAMTPAERVKVATDYLAAMTEFRKRTLDRVSVDVDNVGAAQSEAFFAEAKTVVARAKAGEGGDLGL